jgi:hypothetical protein
VSGNEKYKILMRKHEGNRSLERHRKREWENNIKMHLREMDLEDGNWIRLAQDRERWVVGWMGR